MIKVEFDGTRIMEALQKLENATGDLTPAFLEIKEVLIESTQQRFATKTAPDGSQWPGNSNVTIERKGKNDPLVDGGYLNSEFGSDITGNTLTIFPEKEYAAMQQFGGTKAEFPHLWGDIPARPFLGISPEDEEEILKIVNQHLEDAME